MAHFELKLDQPSNIHVTCVWLREYIPKAWPKIEALGSRSVKFHTKSDEGMSMESLSHCKVCRAVASKSFVTTEQQ